MSANGVTSQLDPDQAVNAAIIVGESVRRGLAPRAASIALVTAMQESKLRNLDYGDLDSVGLFQQRPSQGWGTVAQIMDPWYASGKFYDALAKIPNWQDGDINDVAQAVQRSGVPDGYRQHEAVGRAWASALTGNDPATVSCVNRAGAPASTATLTNYLSRVWPGISIKAEGATLTIATGSETTAWAVAQLAMLRGSSVGLIGVRVGDQSGSIDPAQYAPWATTSTPAQAPVILIFRAG